MLRQNTIRIFGLLFTTLVFQLNAQQDVEMRGVVVEQNSKLKTGKIVYLPAVSIKAPQATPQITDSYGRFKLVFADVPNGNVTRIDVSKDGYEVVNSKVLVAAAVTGRKNPLEIVMCKSGLLYENQIAYYQIASDVLRDQYEKRIKILEQSGKNSNELIAQLQREVDQEIKSKEDAIRSLKEQYAIQNSRMEALAGKFVVVNLDDESEIYRRAFEAFRAKNIERAIVLIDSVKLEERLATNTKELQKESLIGGGFQQSIELRREQIKQDISQCMFKARLHILKSEYKIARQSYLTALQYDSSDVANLWEIGEFLLNQKEGSLAKKCFDKILALQQTDFTKAVALFDLANIYRNAAGPGYEEAEKHYIQSIKLLKLLYESDSSAYRSILADVLTNLGLLYSELEYYTTAAKYFNESDEIFGQTYHTVESRLIPDNERFIWSGVLHNLCLLYAKKRNYYSAERSYYFQAIPLISGTLKYEDRYGALAARELFNFGISQFYLKYYEDAGEHISEALTKARILARQNSSLYSVDLGSMLNGMGQLCLELKFFDNADEFLSEALKITRPLADKNSSDLHLANMSTTLTSLGLVNDARKEYGKAEKFYMEALELQRYLAEKRPMHVSGLAGILNGMGLLYFHLRGDSKASQFFIESLTLYQRLVEKNPEIYSSSLAQVNYNLGNYYNALKNYTQAEKNYQEALKIQDNLIKNEKGHVANEYELAFYSSELTKTLKGLENLYSHWDGNSTAKQFFASLQKQQREINLKNESGTKESTKAAMALGKFYYQIEIYSEAEKSFKIALEQFNVLSKNNPEEKTDYEDLIIGTSLSLVEVYQKELEITQDFSFREKALKLLAAIPSLDDVELQHWKYKKQTLDSFFKNVTKKDLEVTALLKPIEELDSANRQEQDTHLRTVRQEEIVNKLESLFKKYPGSDVLKNRLSVAYGGLAWYCVFVKQFQKTVEFAQKGLTIDPTQTWINTNLALGYLLQGNWSKAKEIYSKYKDEYYENVSFQEAFLNDLKDLREAGIVSPLMRDAEEFLLR